MKTAKDVIEADLNYMVGNLQAELEVMAGKKAPHCRWSRLPGILPDPGHSALEQTGTGRETNSAHGI